MRIFSLQKSIIYIYVKSVVFQILTPMLASFEFCPEEANAGATLIYIDLYIYMT